MIQYSQQRRWPADDYRPILIPKGSASKFPKIVCSGYRQNACHVFSSYSPTWCILLREILVMTSANLFCNLRCRYNDVQCLTEVIPRSTWLSVVILSNPQKNLVIPSSPCQWNPAHWKPDMLLRKS